MPNTTLHGCQVLIADDRTEIRYYCASFRRGGVAGTAAGDYDFCCELLAQDVERARRVAHEIVLEKPYELRLG